MESNTEQIALGSRQKDVVGRAVSVTNLFEGKNHSAHNADAGKISVADASQTDNRTIRRLV